MRILMIMDPGILVPPKGYGGHERLVYMFAKQYAELGHQVDLLVTEGSSVPGCTVIPFGKEGFPPKKADAMKAIPTAWGFLLKNGSQYDLIHNFGRLLYLLPVLNKSVKKIITYGREINSRNIQWVNRLPNKNIVFTGCSSNLISRCNTAGRWESVYNAIDYSKYTLQTNIDKEAPLMFLGRIEKVKGCHTAIQVALKTNHKLIIAGNVSPLEEEQNYFKTEIAPFIDGVQITHVGQVNDEEKNHYLGMSKALLFPIEWNEPFGMVMAEAMACGTPVIGFAKGSVPEVVDEGLTGFVVNAMDEMCMAIDKLNLINRSICRTHAQEKFDVPVIAKKYLGLF